mgnify:CR=1 FL=1
MIIKIRRNERIFAIVGFMHASRYGESFGIKKYARYAPKIKVPSPKKSSIKPLIAALILKIRVIRIKQIS